MRSYVFTDRERKAIRSFLDGKTPINDAAIEQIRSRVKAFKGLASDVDLYVRLRKAVSTVTA